jgi:hypothetical protein
LLFFPLISTFLCDASEWVVLYVLMVRLIVRTFLLLVRMRAAVLVSYVARYVRTDISDPSGRGTLQGYIAFPPAPHDTPYSTLGFWTFMCYFSRALVLLCLISIPGMFLYHFSCSFSVFMFKIVEL